METSPSSTDQQAVLGCILLSADCFSEVKRSGITARSFSDVRCQTIWLALEAMLEAGINIEENTLLSWLNSRHKAADAGGLGYVAALTNSVASAANVQYHIGAVLEAQQRREFAELCRDGQKRVASGGDWKEIADDFKTRFDSIAAIESAGFNGSSILRARRFDPEKEPPMERIIYTLQGIGIATPGNIVSINALVKSGKTAVVEAMQASALSGHRQTDCLGFKSENRGGFAILSFDTEQSKGDHYHHAGRVLKRADAFAMPEWFYSCCCAGLSLRQLVDETEREIAYASKKHGGIHSVFLDGAADFVSDVNVAGECNAFVSRLHGLAIEHDCVVVAAIHYNPGSDGKSRGHLGSQLERKAETNLRLDKGADGVTEIWSDKNRKAPILKGKGPCFAWNNEAEMHLTCQSRSFAANAEKRETLALLADDIFREKPAMHYTDLIEYFTVKCKPKLKDRTAERRVKELSNLGLVVKSVAGLYARGT